MKNYVTAIILLLVFSVQAQDSLKFRFSSIGSETDELMTVPLYENQIQDYRTSQSIRYGVKWASIGYVPLTFFLMNNYHEDCEFLCGAVYLSAIAAVLGCGLAGTLYGYFKGKRLNKIKKSDSEFFTEAFSFGQEFNYFIPIRSEKYFNIEYNPQYSLVYQHFSSNKLIPSEFRLGFTKIEYWENVFDFYMSDMNTKESRLNLDMLFNSNSDVFQLHYGIGVGYSWGEHTTEIDYDNSETKKIDGFFIYPIGGATVNVVDFFYLRFEGYYELSQFKKKVTDFYGKSEFDTFGMKFALGTYLF